MSRAATLCALAALLTAAVAVVPPLFAQSTNGAPPSNARAARLPESAPLPKLNPRQQKALQLMQSVRSDMGRYSPELQTELLLEMADAYQRIDRKRQVALLQQAFENSVNIPDKNIRQNQQYEIVRRLSGADPDAVLALRSAVDPQSRGIVERAVLRQNMRQGKLEDAVQQLTQWDPAWHFPYFDSVNLIKRLPPVLSAERQAVFSAAVAAFRHEDEREFYGFDTLDRLILECYDLVPAPMVTDAIELFLDRAKSKGDSLQATMSGERGTLTFDSVYAADLFEFIPVLQRVDPAKAKALLRENQSVAAQLQRYPKGKASLGDPVADGAGADNVSRTVSEKGSTQMQATNLQMAEAGRLTKAVVDGAGKDYKGALAAAQTLANQSVGGETDISTPRCEALLGIAEYLRGKQNFIAAREALRELVSATRDLPPLIRANYLVHAAALSAQMDDTPTARQELDLGMKAAAEIYQADAFGDPPNTAAKNHWPSTVAWKAMSVVATCMDPDYGISQSAAIFDPEIEATVKMAVAAAIMAKPPVDTEIVLRRGNTTYQMFMEIPWWRGFSGSEKTHRSHR